MAAFFIQEGACIVIEIKWRSASSLAQNIRNFISLTL